MKFARYLESLNRDSPLEWRDKFLRYKLLKKLLKPCNPDQQDVASCEARFFDELRQQMQIANRHFARYADKIICAYHSQQSPPLCCWLLAKRSSQRKDAQLAEGAYWCRKYAKANAVALRKILKKHDKLCQNQKGREFLQECWRSDARGGMGLFLHSPLLDELKAIQDVLHAQLPAEDADLVERAPLPGAKSQQQPKAQPQEPQQPQQLSVTTQLGAGSVSMARASMDSQASSSNWGSHAGGSGECGASYTSPSLRQQRQCALSAIAESPMCMLDTSDYEWCTSLPGPPGAPAPPAGSLLGGIAHLELGADAKPSQLGGFDDGALERQGSPPGEENAPPGLAAAAAGAISVFSEEELKCPICLDVMYKPVGLGCGHKFCRHCALEAAGFGRAIGAFHNIISHISSRTACPQCRQLGVYRDAVALREVGKLIQARYPEEWAERRAEEKARCRQLSAVVGSRQQQLMHSRNAYELLFSL